MRILLLSLFLTHTASALTIKLATLVPENTNWANTLDAMAKEIKAETGVRIKVFYGGIQGDEPDVLRKTRIGQLHGGVFTGKTLGDIHFDTRIVEVPFNFYHDHEKAYKLLKKLTPSLNAKLSKKGFANLGFYGIGKVYVVSTKKVSTLAEMKGIKMWAWEGDHLIEAMMSSIGLVSVPLALPDVLSSLSTGIIHGAYAPPLGVLALQWQNKVKYLIDFPTAYSIGALLINNKRWKKVKPENQTKIMTIAQKHIKAANTFAIEDNQKSLDELKKMGVEFVKFSEDDLKNAESIRLETLKKLSGKFSEEVLRAVKEVR